MRLGALRHYFWSRWRKPWVWIAILVFGLPFMGVYTYALWKGGVTSPFFTTLAAVVGPLLAAMAYLVGSPLPWLWTGDRRPEAPFTRALAQAVAFNGLLIGFLTFLEILLIHLAGYRLEESFRSGLEVAVGFHVPALTLVGWFITSGERTEREKHEAQVQAKEARWILLRGQLSPHFLFNALNGLAELVHTDPAAAEKSILDLAELYRGLLVHGDEELEPLGQERALVERYLAVEGIRLGGRLRVQWDWDRSMDAYRTPPFLVQPLVENALKHGISAFPDGGELRIFLRRDGSGLKIRVANTGKPMGLIPGNGVGLHNLEARLKLAYGERASVQLRAEEGWVVAELMLPMDADKQEAGDMKAPPTC